MFWRMLPMLSAVAKAEGPKKGKVEEAREGYRQDHVFYRALTSSASGFVFHGCVVA